MKKSLMLLVTLVSLIGPSVASAQLAGAILCGIGVYCPPTVPPSKPAGPPPFIMLEGSAIGKTLPEFYSYADYRHLSEMLKGGIKNATPYFQLGWAKEVNSYVVQSLFTVTKTGRRFDGMVPCLQYEHKITVKEESTPARKGNVVATEVLIENACGLTSDLQVVPAGLMFYLTDARNIIFTKPK